MPATHYLACDLGAESGRVMIGTLEDGRVSLRELHRFPSAVLRIRNSLRWNVLQIYDEIRKGLVAAGREGLRISGVSTDSWGVDYVLLRSGEPCLSVPFHYRDSRTDDGFSRVFAKMRAEEIFVRTGIQFMTLNTLFQLNDDAEQRPELLGFADGFLNIADYFNFLMSGVARAEESLASTTQLYNPRERAWALDVGRAIGVPEELFPEVVPSGTILGPMDPVLSAETGLGEVKVIATCSHDTAAAVAAVPARGERWAYLSSGTWSLLGLELPEPVITPQSHALNFTNEIGQGGAIRFLKNLIGLWILQECRRTWASEGREFNYEDLVRLASEAEPLKCLINPDDPRFGKPGDMPSKIAAFCRETGQPEPISPGEFVICILDSLALLYAKTLEELKEVTGRSIDTLHIVGGGSRNALLNQAAADATGCRVLAGPVEATAIGNVLMQAMALGHLADLEAVRSVVKASVAPELFEPQNPGPWQAARNRFATLAKS